MEQYREGRYAVVESPFREILIKECLAAKGLLKSRYLSSSSLSIRRVKRLYNKAKKRDEEALSALEKASPWLQSTLEQNGNLGSLLRNYLGGRQVVEGDVL